MVRLKPLAVVLLLQWALGPAGTLGLPHRGDVLCDAVNVSQGYSLSMIYVYFWANEIEIQFENGGSVTLYNPQVKAGSDNRIYYVGFDDESGDEWEVKPR